MRLNPAQKFNTIGRFLLIVFVFVLVFYSSGSVNNKTKAAAVGNIDITGAGISGFAASVSSPVTPTISFSLPSGLNPSDDLSLFFGGVLTQSAIISSDITIGGSCSGTPVLNFPVGGGVTNPGFSISNLTCGNGISTVSFATGKLSTLPTPTASVINISTPLDNGQFLFFIGGGNDVTISAQVPYIINIKVYPEKRIPAIGHWMNQNTIQIRNVGSTTPIITQVVNMDANGDGVLAPINPSLLPPGTYDFAIKGYSHLRKIYPGTITTALTNLDFTGSGKELLAGDTSVVEDNYVNSLDLSNIARNLYTGDIKNDLNRDTLVNSLDLSNTSFNLYKSGQN